MRIQVKEEFREDFWVDHTNGEPDMEEFWSLGRWPVKAKLGDTIFFYFDKDLVATATVSRVTKPGEVVCQHSGKYENSNKVHWAASTFVDLRRLTQRGNSECLSR